MEIRPATVADLEAVERLLLATFSPPARADPGGTTPDRRIAARIALGQPVAGLLVAVDGWALAGAVTVLTRDTAARPGLRWLPALRPLGLRSMVHTLVRAACSAYRPAPHEAYLCELAVAPAYRRRGIAQQLVRAAEAQARAWDKTLASAFVAPTNTASLGLLRKHGYHEVPAHWLRRHRPRRLEKSLAPAGTPVAATNERVFEAGLRT
jgi:ribosomal protein S18 acetylase RimI-like enzyme